jgi:glycerol-1-phosphate dehydrogenase [NAD(P)+]
MMAEPHPGSLHGEQVGVATLTLSRLQHALLRATRPPEVRPTRLDRGTMRARYGATLGDQLIAQYQAKALDELAAAQMNVRLAEVWPSMKARVQGVMVPTGRLREALEAAGAPTTGMELGLRSDFYRDAVRHAREIRDRYSILDLAGDADLLEDVVAKER